MTINPSQGYGKYQTYVNSIKKSGTTAQKVGGGSSLLKAEADVKTDTVMLSGDAAARAEMERISEAVSADVENLGHADHLAELKEKVQSGEYFVSSGDVADAILNRYV